MNVPEISVSISSEPLDAAAIIGAASTTKAGGIGVFVGVVRETPSGTGDGRMTPSRTGDGDTRATLSGRDDADRSVTHLEYEAHPTLAEERLRDLALDAARKWDLQRVVAVHRTGRCELGEPTVVIACSAPHRAEALDSCRWLIDEIKREVPIWKKEHYSHGSTWI